MPLSVDISNWNLSGVANTAGMFANTSFNQDISGWDVSHVTNMTGMFENAVEFNQDISGWNVANVAIMDSMFNGATDFAQDLSLWEVTTITDKPKKFSSGSSIATGPKFGAINGVWYYPLPYPTDPTNVAWAGQPDGYTFTANVGISSTAPLTDMTRMFAGRDEDFFPYIKDWNTSHVTTMEGCFAAASNFGTPEFVTNPDANNVIIEQSTSAGDAFYTTKYNELNALDGDWVIEAGPNDGSDDVDLPATLPFDVLFGGTTYIAGSTIYINSNSALWFNGTNVAYNYDTYEEKKTQGSVISLDRLMLGWGDYSINTIETRISGTAPNRVYTIRAKLSQDYAEGAQDPVFEPNFWWVAMYENDPGIFDIVIETYDLAGQMADEDLWAFGNANQASTFTFNDPTNTNNGSGGLSQGATRVQFIDAQNIAPSVEEMTLNWNTSNVTKMEAMFQSATNCAVQIGNWDTSSVTNMRFMFDRASSMNSDLSNWDTSSVTSMYKMFKETAGFSGAGFGNWDVSNVTSMHSMFEYASGLSELDLTGWNPAVVETTYYMFSGSAYNGAGMNSVVWPELREVNGMFSWQSVALTNDNEPINWSMPKALSFNRMFYRSSNFNTQFGTIDWGSHWIDTAFTTDDEGYMLYNNTYDGYEVDVSFFLSECSTFNNGQAAGESTAPMDFPFLRIGATGTANEGYRVKLEYMFYQNESLNNFFTTPITGTTLQDQSLLSFLDGAYVFNNPLITNLNVSGVTNFQLMFASAYAFNQPIGTWDVSAGTDFTSTFYVANTFNQDISSWTRNDNQYIALDDFALPGNPPLDGIIDTANLPSFVLQPFEEHYVIDNPNAYGTSQSDAFSNSIAATPSYIIVGAYNEDANNDTNSGKAYIFHTANGALLHTLDNPNVNAATTGDLFGTSVAISDTYALVGAPREDDIDAGTSGKAYIFDITTGNLLHTLDNPNAYGTAVGDEFGQRVGLTDSYAIIGARYEDDASGSSAGKVYGFSTANGALLYTVDNPNVFNTPALDQYGTPIACNENYFVTSAVYEDTTGASTSGVVYIHDITNGALLHTIENPNPYGSESSDQFGYALGVSENYLIASAIFEDALGYSSSGKAYIYNIATGQLLHTLSNPFIESSAYYGQAVSVNENYAVVGASKKHVTTKTASSTTISTDSGEVYVYDVTTGLPITHIRNPNAYGTATNDQFGRRTWLTANNDLVVGVRYEDDEGGSSSGKSYVFDLSNLT